MKYLFLLLFLTGCSLTNSMCKVNPTDMRMFCNDVVGYNYDNETDTKIGTLEKNIRDINDRLRYLESSVNEDKNKIKNIGQSIILIQDLLNNQEDSISELSATYQQLQQNIQTHSDSLSTLDSSIISLQEMLAQNEYNATILSQGLISLNELYLTLNNQVNESVIEIAELQGHSYVKDIIDPCGQQINSYNEIFLRLSDGKIIASFSDNYHGANTRFTVITPSNSQVFTTSDGTNCNFKVPASGPNRNKVCWGQSFNTCI